VFTADAHCDTLSLITFSKGVPAVTPDRLRLGGVGLQVFAIYAAKKDGSDRPYLKARAMIDNIGALGVPALRGELPEDPPDSTLGVISLEGGEILEGSVERLYELDRALRLRMIALTWNYENEIGSPALSGSERGLKPFGLQLLSEMDAAGILADVSHLNEAGFWDVVERAELPPVASHSNLKSICDHPRNLTDRQARAIIERGGFIGVNFYPRFLCETAKADISDIVRHIDAIVQMGGVGCAGFGSDFDGIEYSPEGVSNPSCFPAILDRLRILGYGERDIARIAGLNLWELLKKAEAIKTPVI
jgi:membrane dipeptidase